MRKAAYQSAAATLRHRVVITRNVKTFQNSGVETFDLRQFVKT